MADGRVIASDTHDGFTGNENQRNLYRLSPSDPSGIINAAKVVIRVVADGSRKDSYGDITLLGSKVLEQYNPVNYPLGTVPLGYWQNTDLADASKPITIPLSGAIKKAGTYQVELRNTRGRDAFTVKKLAVLQNGSEVAALNLDVQCGPDKKSVYLALAVRNIAASAPLELQVFTQAGAGTDSRGEIWITKLVKLEAAAS